MEIEEIPLYLNSCGNVTSGQTQGKTPLHTSGSLRCVLAHEAEQVSNVVQTVQELACWWEWEGNS